MEGLSDYTPQKAIFIYGNEAGNSFLKTHDVHVINNCPVLGEGRAMSEDAVKNFVADLADNHLVLNRGGILPRNILSVKPNGDLLWYVKGKTRLLSLNKQTGLESGLAPFPTLLFALTGSMLRAFALKTVGAPNEKSKLYRLPLWNLLSEEGNMCMGNADFLTEGTYQEIMDKAEDGFFNSQFSHANTTACKSGDIAKMWGKLIGTDKPFPKKELLPSKLYNNLADFMSSNGF